MPGFTLSKRLGRLPFLISLIGVAALGFCALRLLQAHSDSRHAHFAVGYCLVILGVVWVRSLESRLQDAGLPRWVFWPFFLIVFTACLGGHLAKIITGPETLGLFLLLQLPAILFQSHSTPTPTGGEVAPVEQKPARPIAPISSVEFAIHLFLLINLWNVLHLLYGDVSGFTHGKDLRIALNVGSWLLLAPWYFTIRGRLKVLERARWTAHFCALTLIPCLLLFYFHELHFLPSLILFAILQLPAIFFRRQWISTRWIPKDVIVAPVS